MKHAFSTMIKILALKLLAYVFSTICSKVPKQLKQYDHLGHTIDDCISDIQTFLKEMSETLS